jgi:hypothetical protein
MAVQYVNTNHRAYHYSTRPTYLHLPTYIYIIWNAQDPQVPSFSSTKTFSRKRPYEAYWARKEDSPRASSFLPVWLSPAGQSLRPTPT